MRARNDTRMPASVPYQCVPLCAYVCAPMCVCRLGVAGSILCACLAVRLRFITVAAAPWLAQLLGYALVCSNSEVGGGRRWRLGGLVLMCQRQAMLAVRKMLWGGPLFIPLVPPVNPLCAAH